MTVQEHLLLILLYLLVSGLFYYMFINPNERDKLRQVELHEQKITKMELTIKNLKEQNAILSTRVKQLNEEIAPKSTTAANFVNWGQKSCPGDTKTIYSGYAAKSAYDKEGGGINFMCLTDQPTFYGKEVGGFQDHSAAYGVEYWAMGINSIYPEGNRHNDVPCSVCEVEDKFGILMIPGTKECPKNWKLEYTGYIMAEHTNHKNPSDFICVNKEYQYLDGGSGNQLSGYTIPVEVICGVIRCPPYKDGMELACVVCSK